MPRRFFRRVSNNYLQKQEKPWYLRPFSSVMAHPTFFSVSRRSICGALWAGLFVALIPMPAQTVAAALLALLLRVNLPVAVVAVWVTNPITMLPIFYFEYGLGCLILDLPMQAFDINLSWDWLAEELQGKWKPLLLGSFITATVTASLAYVAVSVTWRWLVTLRYRKRRQAGLTARRDQSL
jgi:uncharacterized protein (DUF2062 family)